MRRPSDSRRDGDGSRTGIIGRVKREGAIFLTAGILALGVTGCGPSKEAKELRLAGIEALEQGDCGTALEKLESALESGKGAGKDFRIDTMQYIAEAQYRSGDYKAAAGTLGDLVSLDGDRAEFWYLKAAAEACDSDYEQALADLNTAGKKDKKLSKLTTPGAEDAILLTAKALAEGGDADTAMELLDRFADKAAEETVRDFRVTRSFVFEKRGEWAKAAETLESVLRDYGEDEAIRKEYNFALSRKEESEG